MEAFWVFGIFFCVLMVVRAAVELLDENYKDEE